MSPWIHTRKGIHAYLEWWPPSIHKSTHTHTWIQPSHSLSTLVITTHLSAPRLESTKDRKELRNNGEPQSPNIPNWGWSCTLGQCLVPSACATNSESSLRRTMFDGVISPSELDCFPLPAAHFLWVPGKSTTAPGTNAGAYLCFVTVFFLS